MNGEARLRRLVIGVGLLLLLCGILPGAVGAVEMDSTAGSTGSAGLIDSADTTGVAETTREPPGTDPLENGTGTTEVVVRFPPLAVDDADAEGDEVVDELRDHAAAERTAFEAFADGHPAVTIEREFWLANAVLVRVDADAVDADELIAVANVTRVHGNVVVDTVDRPRPTSDRRSSEDGPIEPAGTGNHTPGLELIGVADAWDRFDTRGAGATVAVIDTGVDPTHRDVTVDAWASFDENGTLVSDDVADAADPDGHGTHVAGTVAGGDASGSHIGVAPDAALYAIDAFGEDGTATFASTLAAMQRATADEDVDVLQMSLGATGTFGGFIAPVRNARAADTVVVAAAGNEGHNTSSSPANVYDSLAVGAVRNDRTVPAFSSGEPINKTAAFREPPAEWPDHYVVPDVSAPGVDVRSAEAGTTDGYVVLQGTSMAAPHVSGIAALAVSATDGRVEADAVHASIVDTAVHPGDATEPDDRHGHGVVDAEAAVAAAVVAAPPTPSPTPSPTGTPTEIEPATSDDAPGFGVAIAIAAVLALLTTATRIGSAAGHAAPRAGGHGSRTRPGKITRKQERGRDQERERDQERGRDRT